VTVFVGEPPCELVDDALAHRHFRWIAVDGVP